MEESMIYKKIRKYIIKCIRLPIWIICFLFNTKYNSTSKKAIQEVQITVNKLIKLRDLNIIKVVI